MGTETGNEERSEKKRCFARLLSTRRYMGTVMLQPSLWLRTATSDGIFRVCSRRRCLVCLLVLDSQSKNAIRSLIRRRSRISVAERMQDVICVECEYRTAQDRPKRIRASRKIIVFADEHDCFQPRIN